MQSASFNQKVQQSTFLNSRITYFGAGLYLSLHLIAPNKGQSDLNKGGSLQNGKDTGFSFFLLKFLSPGEPYELVYGGNANSHESRLKTDHCAADTL